MSSEILRRAAAAMRQRAEAATPGPWECTGDHLVWPSENGPGANDAILGVLSATHMESAEHIASWHPDVALAVADSLDATAEVVDRLLSEKRWPKGKVEFGARHQLAVARAYLGESA